MTSHRQLGIAVVGYGAISRRHTEILASEGQYLRWVVGRRPEPTAAFAREYGFAKHGTDLRMALDDPAVDAVMLCTPNQCHAAQTAACLEACKHVFVEIPLAMNYLEGKSLAEMARDRGLTLMVGHTTRFHESMIRAREEVVSGRLAIDSVIARWTLMRRQNVGSNGYVRSWTDSLLWHHGQHATDTVLWLLGIDEVDQVDVTATFSLPDARQGVPLDLALVLRTRCDQLATVAVTHNSFVKICDFVLMGREQTLVIDDAVLRNQDRTLHQPVDDDSRLRQDREFLAAVRDGRPASVSGHSVLPALQVLQIAQNTYDAWRPAGATHPERPHSAIRSGSTRDADGDAPPSIVGRPPSVADGGSA